jgi:hypothetical protein
VTNRFGWIKTIGYSNIVATFAFATSALALYLQFLRPSSLVLSVGDAISVNHNSSGIPEVYLPVSIDAQGSNAQVINRLALVIKFGDNKFGLMRNFCTLVEDKDSIAISSKFTPISLEAHTNLSKIIGFGLGTEDFKDWIPSVGTDYEFWIIGWTASNDDPRNKPDIKKKFKFNFSSKQVQAIEDAKKENKRKGEKSKNEKKDVNENFNLRSVSWSFKDFPESGYINKDKLDRYLE